MTDESALLQLFRWLDVSLPGTRYLRESEYAFAFLLTVHVLAICVFVGLVLMMDLRLAGIGNRRTPAAEIQQRLFPLQMLGFVAAALTGIALVYSRPLTYYGKGFVWVKLGLIVLAGINAAAIHRLGSGSDHAWDSGAARFAGVSSLVLWAGVIVTGRLVAYSWFTTDYF